MLGVAVLCLFILFGIVAVLPLFPRRGPITRLWLGASAGLAMMMWFPSLFAFFMDFTLQAQYCALGLAALLATGSFLFAWRTNRLFPQAPKPEPPLKLLLAVLIPLVILCAFLQHTHTLREVDGALHVGQATYGDLNLHLGIATGLRGASYPPEYTLLPGTLLGYPFLMDALSTTMLLFGTSLRMSFIIPGTLMMALVFLGFLLYAWELSRSGRAIVVALLLFAFNGGLGFLYTFDFVASDPSRLLNVFSGFYQTPANMPDLNLRWSNVIADMMVPQRTLLAGWVMGLPALWLLLECIKERRIGLYIALGIWVGAIPMVHTHTFLAVGLLSIGALMYMLWRGNPEERLQTFLHFALYGAIAIALALPQLITWTFPQTTGGGSLGIRFNWVNNNDGGLIDGYFWFWIKNVGLIYLLMVPAARSASFRGRAFAIGALLIYLVAEFIQFQPNPYDNNKLFYVAFIAMLPLVGRYLVSIYDRLKGVHGRALIAAVFLGASLLSGALSVAREVVSDYQLYSRTEAAAAAYVDQNAPTDAVFLTGTQHNNPIASLSGRNLVCGTSTFLYFHGIDTSAQREAVSLMYSDPNGHAHLFSEYVVDYVYISSYERGEFSVDAETLASLYPVWYEDNDVVIYAVSNRARAGAGAAPGA